MKDNFSNQAASYARFRPVYPKEMFDLIGSFVTHKHCAWDCGTGNGQVAGELANVFEQVYATDISEKQLAHAIKQPNIVYSLQPAESTNFADDMFDLVTVSQAIHWFDFDRFYAEVKRTLKPGGILAVAGYKMFIADDEVNPLIRDFYVRVTGPYWDPERRYIDEDYRTIPFPFRDIPVPDFTMNYYWTAEQAAGYFSTWSAVQHFIAKNGYNLVDEFATALAQSWGDQPRKVSFPVLLRVARNDI
ncbi:class I SAM-dependent methyltransferase [Hufsiella ginkgonis]|uniref:Methyltransferase domain-containing protein n=1 Tax=Hufsiella ginkgonis TaxID=2695274 RepID=A0A7K1XX54_9SPHI|nr:class I SAM-dependent methyltransferase [Hufsiella ginkgonis]MXV15398.1 methyltransferase domain-containing protein [Hufsiella ginkgonis]